VIHNHRRLLAVGRDVARADAYVGVEPDSARIAVRLARRFRSHAVFDVHEPYEDEILRRWVPDVLHRPATIALRRAIRRLCADVDLVVGVNDAVIAPYADIPTPMLVVRNCAPAVFAEGGPSAVCAPGRKRFTVLQGKASGNHGAKVVIQAFGLMANTIPAASVVFFEAFDANLSRQEFERCVRDSRAADVVDLRPRIPMAEMPTVLRSCDAGLIAYSRKLGEKSLPNKLFEFMAAGVPVIAPIYSTEIARIVNAERCGILVDCERPEEIASAVAYLHDHPAEAIGMGRRGHDAFVQRHSFEADVRPFVDLVRSWSQ